MVNPSYSFLICLVSLSLLVRSYFVTLTLNLINHLLVFLSSVEGITAIVNSLPPVVSPVSISESISEDPNFYTDTALIIARVSVIVVAAIFWFYGVPNPFAE